MESPISEFQARRGHQSPAGASKAKTTAGSKTINLISEDEIEILSPPVMQTPASRGKKIDV